MTKSSVMGVCATKDARYNHRWRRARIELFDILAADTPDKDVVSRNEAQSKIKDSGWVEILFDRTEGLNHKDPDKITREEWMAHVETKLSTHVATECSCEYVEDIVSHLKIGKTGLKPTPSRLH